MKGFTKIPNEILLDRNLDPIAKIVLAGLGYYDRGRGCFAKRTTMAKLLNVSIYQLRKALKVLEEGGYIVINKRHNGHTDVINRVINNETHRVEKVSTPIIRKQEEIIEEEVAPTFENVSKDTEATERYNQALINLLGFIKWEQWFADTFVEKEYQTKLIVRVPSKISADFITKHYRNKIEQEIGKSLEFKLLVDKSFANAMKN